MSGLKRYPAACLFAMVLCGLGLWAAAAPGVGWAQAADAAEEESAPPWKATKGPLTGHLGSTAEIRVPAGYTFLDGDNTRTLMTALQNPTNGRELGTVGPESLDWFLVFEFDPSGYVKDTDKDELDASAMLQAMKTSNEAGNRQRAQQGWAALELVGWETPPHYDPATNHLEWALRASSEGHDIINYNTRLLGRHGVMEVTLVVEPDELQATLPTYKKLLSGYTFKAGEKYSEFRAGDKVATYGLAALVTGGAAAVAVKSGLLSKLWKPIALGIAALLAFLKKIFSGGSRSST